MSSQNPTEIHTLTIGNQDRKIPNKTEVTCQLSSFDGGIDAKVKFPGQSHFTEYKALKIKDGTLNIPAKLTFLSYSSKTSAEKQFVQNLSNDLWRDGIMSWWDKQNLLFGDNWKPRIKAAIASSDYFLIILSKNALESKGYIHQELKIALEEQDLFPKNKRFIIPILLNDCPPPESLKDFHYLNVQTESDWYNKLKESLLTN